LVLAVGVVGVGAGSSLVSAQPCSAQLGSPSTLSQQYLSFQVSVPVSASCSFSTGQLYAAGTAYDTVYNSNIGTANTILSATYGAYGFTGQLQFNLPSSAASHPVQFSVSIYSTQPGYYQQYYGGSVLTTTSATFIVGPSYLNSYQNYPYPYYSTYPTYPTYPAYPSYPYNPGNNYYYYYSHPYSYYNQNRGGYYYYYYYRGGGYYNHPCSGSHSYCNHH